MLRTSLLLLTAAALTSGSIAQSPCFAPNLGTVLPLADDATSPALPLGFPFTFGGVAYTDIRVCSNGYIWLGNPAVPPGGDFSPTEAELLLGPARICPLWSDFNPAAPGSGQIFFDNATPGLAKVTWAGVFPFGTTTPVDFQITFDASNTIAVTYGAPAIPGTLNPSILIGASPGLLSLPNPVTFASRPFAVTSDTFSEVLAVTPGNPIPYGFFRMQWTPTNPGFAIADATCTAGPLPPPARATAFGEGCPSSRGPSMFELFNFPNQPDLDGLDLSFEPTAANGYVVRPGLSSAWFAGFANNLGAGDDTTHQVTLPFPFPYRGGTVETIYVSSNGFLTLGPTDPGAGCCSGSVLQLLSGGPRIAGFWEDLNPAASGPGAGVFADLDAITGELVVTWNQVFEFGSLSRNTFQIALSPSGMFTMRWLDVQVFAGTFLVGYSRGGNAPNLGQTDLSTVNGTVVSGEVLEPLSLSPVAGSRPVLGTAFVQEVNGIAAFPDGVVTILLTGAEQPAPIPLDSIGLLGCTAYLQVPEFFSSLNLTLGFPSTAFALSIPSDPFLGGIELVSQALSDDVEANAFGFRVSNGVRWRIGL